MGKYLVLWEIDNNRIPVSPQERKTLLSSFVDMVKEDQKKGTTKDWGAFVGEIGGYVVVEGTELELHSLMQKWIPFCLFKVHPIISFDQVGEMIKGWSG
jgi:hypothetical protein